MTFDNKIHRRKSIRLQNYDYSQTGAYFITVCTQDRECILGEIVDCKMQLNDAGRIIQSAWDEIPVYFLDVELDEFVIMPNHVHGIINILGAASSAPTIGKIMRRLLKEIASNGVVTGDTTTLEDLSAITRLATEPEE